MCPRGGSEGREGVGESVVVGRGCGSLGKLSQLKGLLLSSEMNRLIGPRPCENSPAEESESSSECSTKAMTEVIKVRRMFTVTGQIVAEIAAFPCR